MKKLLGILVLGLLLSENAYAGEYNPYKVGDIVENEVVCGKGDKFPLPPGKFTVSVIHKKKEFYDMMLYQYDESGVVRWAVNVMGTGTTQWEYWNPPDCCKRTNVYFIKKKSTPSPVFCTQNAFFFFLTAGSGPSRHTWCTPETRASPPKHEVGFAFQLLFFLTTKKTSFKSMGLILHLQSSAITTRQLYTCSDNKYIVSRFVY